MLADGRGQLDRPGTSRVTFGEYAEAWLESRADLKPKTRHQYQWLMRQHIMPTWRTVPIAKVTFEGLTRWVSRLSAAGLGPSAIRQSVFVVSAALDHVGAKRPHSVQPSSGPGPAPAQTPRLRISHPQARSSRSPPMPGVIGC